ncbi:MAG: T9SS type A sorting domain-containing protein [Chlorobiota bacterium]
MKTLIFLITIISSNSHVLAGEMVLEWEHKFGSHVSAFNILQGGDDMLLTVYEGRFEIRSIADGTLKGTYEMPVEGIDIHYAQLTPDSLRVLIAYGGRSDYQTSFELIDLEKYTSIKTFEIPLEGDTITEYWNKYVNRFVDIEIDPIRPYVYFILKKALPVQSVDEEKEYYTIKVYNYETGEEIRELDSYKNDDLKFIDISHNGKYLASLNEREAQINIWDLETFSPIKSYRLFRNNPDKAWKTIVSDLRFSELKSDIIYFSGRFSKIGNPYEFENGVFEYSIERGDHINLLPSNTYVGRLIFAENEKLLFLNSGFTYLFFDFPNKNREYFSQPNNENSISSYAIYSLKYKFFIGGSGRGAVEKGIRSMRYLTETNIENQDQNDNNVYPNPTTDNVTIETICNNSEVKLEIIDINGSVIKQDLMPISNGNISISLLGLPIGTYFLKVGCGNKTYTYNVVKEG